MYTIQSGNLLYACWLWFLQTAGVLCLSRILIPTPMRQFGACMHKDSTYLHKDSTSDAVGAVADDSAVTNAAGCAVVCMELETWVTKKNHA